MLDELYRAVWNVPDVALSLKSAAEIAEPTACAEESGVARLHCNTGISVGNKVSTSGQWRLCACVCGDRFRTSVDEHKRS